MSDTSVGLLFAIGLLFFAMLGGFLLVWPAKFLRYIQNPLEPDTPINRVHARSLGVVLFLFALMAATTSVKQRLGFHKNILFALWASFVILPIFLWLLWRFSALKRVNRSYLAGEAEEPRWEVKMTVAFCTLLSMIVLGSFVLAAYDIFPK
jgi:Mn2+/Fe2+ NRAMP family transporter